MKKFTFFLMTYKGYSVLHDIIEKNYTSFVHAVVIGTDKNTINDYSSEMSQLCKDNGIKYYFRSDKFEVSSDYIVTVSWRWMIKNVKQKVIIFHESLLPQYRGFAPLVNQLINGEKELGLTVLWGEKKYDSGDIINQYKLKINYPIKIQRAIEEVSELYKVAVRGLIEQLSQKNYIESAWSQNTDNISFSLWRDEKDYFINWSDSSEKIKRFIDSVGFPYKGAHSLMGDDLIIINDAIIFDDVNIEIRDVGKIIFFDEFKPVVVCKTGLIKIIDAVYEKSAVTIFPLKKFRLRMS